MVLAKGIFSRDVLDCNACPTYHQPRETFDSARFFSSHVIVRSVFVLSNGERGVFSDLANAKLLPFPAAARLFWPGYSGVFIPALDDECYMYLPSIHWIFLNFLQRGGSKRRQWLNDYRSLHFLPPRSTQNVVVLPAIKRSLTSRVLLCGTFLFHLPDGRCNTWLLELGHLPKSQIVTNCRWEGRRIVHAMYLSSNILRSIRFRRNVADYIFPTLECHPSR